MMLRRSQEGTLSIYSQYVVRLFLKTKPHNQTNLLRIISEWYLSNLTLLYMAHVWIFNTTGI